MEQQIPLSHEASAGDTNMRVTSELPQEVVQCLDNARFLHLATCSNNIPHVSLMNYTYLPSSPYSAGPVIIMTTNPASKKMTNLITNPNVSLLVHDWVSHRPSTASQTRRLSSPSSSHSPTRGAAAPPSSLAALLYNLNASAISSISATISGRATLVDRDTPEEHYYRDVHLANNTFDDAMVNLGGGNSREGEGEEAGGQLPNGISRFAEGGEARVIVVGIRDVRISDYKGAVRDWVIAPAEGGRETAADEGR